METTIEERELLREKLGLNDAMLTQFLRFVGNAIRGDFGVSYQFKRPVAMILGERMPATLELAFVSSILALVAGIPVGVYTALRYDSVLANCWKLSGLRPVTLRSNPMRFPAASASAAPLRARFLPSRSLSSAMS